MENEQIFNDDMKYLLKNTVIPTLRDKGIKLTTDLYAVKCLIDNFDQIINKEDEK